MTTKQQYYFTHTNDARNSWAGAHMGRLVHGQSGVETLPSLKAAYAQCVHQPSEERKIDNALTFATGDGGANVPGPTHAMNTQSVNLDITPAKGIATRCPTTLVSQHNNNHHARAKHPMWLIKTWTTVRRM